MMPVNCPKCKATLLGDVFNTPDLAPCPSCNTPLSVELFPAFFRPPIPVDAGEPLVVEGESSCFYHPQKKAVIPCEACGRFLCALCDLELNGQHLCPSCLETGKKKGKLAGLETRRTLHDQLALALVLAPLLFWPMTLLTAPIAMYVCIRHWRSPGSIVRHGNGLKFIVMLLAGLEMGGWAILFYFLYKRS